MSELHSETRKKLVKELASSNRQAFRVGNISERTYYYLVKEMACMTDDELEAANNHIDECGLPHEDDFQEIGELNDGDSNSVSSSSSIGN